MPVEKQWFAVYTRPRWEKKVSRLLGKKGVEFYCPMNRTIRQWADRKKVVEEPLFSCYVFVQISAQDIVTVKRTEGVLNFVYWLGRPAVVKDDEIAVIRKIAGMSEHIALEKVHVREGNSIRITHGPFMDLEGKVVAAGKSRLKVYLPSLGYNLVLDTRESNVEIVYQPVASLLLTN